MKKHLFICCMVLLSGVLYSQGYGEELGSLSRIRNGVKSMRISSHDTTGYGADSRRAIKDGEKICIMNVKGAGIITHIWITIWPVPDQLSRNDIMIRMYWDGNSFPSVESPVGPFFGNGWNETYNFFSAPLCVAPNTSYVSYFHMPFAEGARIEIENQSGKEITSLYYYVDYIGVEKLPKDAGRFHAWYNHELTGGVPPLSYSGTYDGANTSGSGNYLFADIRGKGHFVGVNYYINNPSTIWYGEGNDMLFIDGDTLPTLVGTGTEDFFNTSWSPKELFHHPNFGYARVNNETGWLGHTHVYRFFITDPVCFNSSLKFTIEHGHANDLTLDLASVAYWYQSKASALPRSFTKEERQHKPLIGLRQIHEWREVWRLSKGIDQPLWGDEIRRR